MGSEMCIRDRVYHALLANKWTPTGLQLVTDFALHTVMPVLYIVEWIVFSNKRDMNYQRIPYWLIYPVTFGVWTLVHGAFIGTYPYFFLDVATYGVGQVLINMTIFTAIFAAGAALMIKVSVVLPHGKTQTL